MASVARQQIIGVGAHKLTAAAVRRGAAGAAGSRCRTDMGWFWSDYRMIWAAYV